MLLEYKSGGRGEVCWATMSCGGHGTVNEGLFRLTCCYENKGSSKKSVFFPPVVFAHSSPVSACFGCSVRVRFLNATLRGRRSSLALKKNQSMRGHYLNKVIKLLETKEQLLSCVLSGYSENESKYWCRSNPLMFWHILTASGYSI